MTEKLKSVFYIICIVCLPLIVINRIYYFFADSQALSNMQKFGESIKPMVEIIAIILAGIWTYRVFIKNRTDYPVVETTHYLTHYSINDNYTLLFLNVIVKNISNVLVKITYGEAFIQQIMPISPDIIEKIESANYQKVMDGKSANLFLKNQEIGWYEIGHREENWKSTVIKIEPGESDEFQYEFIIEKEVEVIKAVTYYENPKLKDLGWRKTTIYSLIRK